MPTTKRIAVTLIAVMTLTSVDVSRAGCLDWLWRRPQTVNYAPPTTVGYAPTGVYQNAGPAASYYTSNYAPNYRPQGVAPAAGYNTVYRAPLNGGYPAPTTTFYRAPRTTYYRAPTTNYYRAAAPASYYAPRYAAPLPANAARTTTNYAPNNAFYAPNTSNYAPNGYTSYAPTTAYQPVQPPRRSWFGGLFRWGAPCDGQSPCRPYTATSVNYAAPRTNFRPVWQRVPVTYYRPLTSVDPVTGQSVQRMQPCTTYRWQIQQRPAMLPQHAAPAMQQGVPCEPTPASPNGGATNGDATNGSSRSNDPYYDRSRIIRPSDGGLVPKDAEIIRDERVPADERPSLRGLPPAPETGALDRTTTRRAASTRVQATERQRPTERPGLMLDPNADDRLPQPPPLLSPRDKTAYQAPTFQRVAYQAQWPHAKPTVRRASRSQGIEAPVTRNEASVARPLTRRQPTRRLDDSGWRSLRD